MALQFDSVVTDLMFQATAAFDQKTLVEGLGGQAALEGKQLVDVDMHLGQRAEMELSPSVPFRRRGERRLFIIDDQITPRQDPQNDPLIKTDLRPYKEALISICQQLPVRLGRLFALGSWGDAVLVARSARDLRGICLVPWALDPQTDMDGKRRATPLSQKEFEAKLLAFEKRLEELDDQQILSDLAGLSFERRGDLVVVDVLEADGTWDQRKSMLMEQQLAAIERFSMIPGAPATQKPSERPTRSIRAAVVEEQRAAADGKAGAGGGAGGAGAAAAGKAGAGAAGKAGAGAGAAAAGKAAPPAPPEPKPEPKGPPIAAHDVGGAVVLVFPAERFDLDVAAALGKRDWDQVVRRTDNLPGEMRDKIQRDGAAWIAPIEFLSEVFVDGKPLTKAEFERTARSENGVRSLEVHFPRFGAVTLLEIAGKGRFVTSLDDAARAAKLLM
jgi:hypothetical protein